MTPEESERFRRIWRSAYRLRGVNFMTPHIMRQGFIKGDVVYELSKGSWVNNTKLFGVTVATNDKQLTEISKCCHSRKEADEYIEYLKSMEYQDLLDEDIYDETVTEESEENHA